MWHVIQKDGDFAARVLALSCGLAATAAVFLLAAWALRIKELTAFMQFMRRPKADGG